ncbi:CDP-alcohol phosphatidyltransferase family protein [Methanomicrobium antiquum]|uniref:CDP-alcohol phosphatidyltransferase family protein n=1 Tax=Methanomicrobium antiquum TaxID=487686 RepID=A0AAF0JKY1_9EURY|nr:CDP-alcohol phosphatidyltransferase family protein [Methanomicrobium antiquum]MDD3976840.1 CDP-alcohol phosphatidyltransferase family protein [Methanomicrobium sp.]WFN36054.1 CDP-alcohol phosphatidyltransferase family protein [Methanomicrobium antiquum]
MNITALRPKFIGCLEPVADIFIKLRFTPNMISVLSLIAGLITAYFFFRENFFIGAIFLLISAVLDLVDGTVARKTGNESKFGAVFDWIVDKYVDSLVILGIGLSGVAIISPYVAINGVNSYIIDFAIVALAIIGSLMNTFIKPVTYAEVGFEKREDGKIDDPLERVGFFGRPETILFLVAGGLFGLIAPAVVIIAVCTNLSALQRIIYLYIHL